LSDAFPVEDRRYVWLMLAMNGALRQCPKRSIGSAARERSPTSSSPGARESR